MIFHLDVLNQGASSSLSHAIISSVFETWFMFSYPKPSLLFFHFKSCLMVPEYFSKDEMLPVIPRGCLTFSLDICFFIQFIGIHSSWRWRHSNKKSLSSNTILIPFSFFTHRAQIYLGNAEKIACTEYLIFLNCPMTTIRNTKLKEWFRGISSCF